MAIEKERFFKIINEVSESQGLNEDNLLQKIKDELYEVERKLPEEDCGEYNKFKNDLWKDHLFSVKTSNGPVDYTLLHLAIESNNVLMVKLLINKTVRVDMRIKDGSSNGLTALHIAASHGYEEIVQLLLDANANPLLEDSQGRTPRKMVEMIDNIKNREVIIKRLETAEKNYSPKKAKDLNIKLQDGSTYHLLQGSHGTSASSAVNGNGIDSYSKRCDATCDDETSSDDSGLESEQTTPNTSFHFEMNSNGTNHVEENVDNKTLESTLRSQIQLKDSRIQELEKSDKELKEVKKKLEKAQEDRLKGFSTENETKQEALNKLGEENQSLRQRIQDLENENTAFNSELEKNKDQHSNYIAEHEAKLEALNKQNQEKSKLQEQEIKNLKSENATLKGELEKNKNQHSQTSEVPLKKVEKKPPLSKIAYVGLVATSMVGSILSIVSGLFVLSIIATSVTSALVAGGITYMVSKPTTELKEVATEGLVQHGVGKVNL